MNIAYYFYLKGDFAAMRKHLQKVAFDDEFYALDTRSLLLKSFLEDNDLEAVIQLSDSFSKYLKRNKIIDDRRRNAHLNRIRIIRNLVQILSAASLDRDRLNRLRQKVFAMEPLMDRDYLIVMIDRLLKQG